MANKGRTGFHGNLSSTDVSTAAEVVLYDHAGNVIPLSADFQIYITEVSVQGATAANPTSVFATDDATPNDDVADVTKRIARVVNAGGAMQRTFPDLTPFVCAPGAKVYGHAEGGAGNVQINVQGYVNQK